MHVWNRSRQEEPNNLNEISKVYEKHVSNSQNRLFCLQKSRFRRSDILPLNDTIGGFSRGDLRVFSIPLSRVWYDCTSSMRADLTVYVTGVMTTLR